MDWKTRIAKRAIDVVGSSVGLAMTAPLFPVVAAAVKLSSKGPVLYSQTRCAAERRSDIAPSRPPHTERRRRRGYNTFQMFKFRTMRTDAEQATGAVLAQENDPRLTAIGGFLRRTRLDELPQLVHVFRGDMSLVGPRPERPELLQQIEDHLPYFQERMRLIKPGITGLAQIRLNYDGSFSDQKETAVLETFLDSLTLPDTGEDDTRMFANKLLFDLSYSAILENPLEALKTDLEIMVKTPLIMLLGKGR